MEATLPAVEPSSSAVPEPEVPEDHIFRKYYTDRDYFLSPEGLLKLLSAVVCVVSAVMFGRAGRCPGAPALAGGAAGAAAVCGAALALLYAAVALGLPLYAPQLFLFTDIIVSTVMGVLLLITAVLSMTVCEFASALSYVHGPLAVMNSGMVTASAVITYIAVMRLWDAARPALEPPRPPPAEQEV